MEHAMETSATELLSFFCDMLLMLKTPSTTPNSFAASITLQTLNLDVVNHHNFLNPWGRWCDDDAATRPDATPVIQCRCCDDNDGAMASLMTNTNGVSYVNAAPSWSSSDLSNPFAFSSSLFISKIEIFCCEGFFPWCLWGFWLIWGLMDSFGSLDLDLRFLIICLGLWKVVENLRFGSQRSRWIFC